MILFQTSQNSARKKDRISFREGKRQYAFLCRFENLPASLGLDSTLGDSWAAWAGGVSEGGGALSLSVASLPSLSACRPSIGSSSQISRASTGVCCIMRSRSATQNNYIFLQKANFFSLFKIVYRQKIHLCSFKNESHFKRKVSW